MKEMGRGQWRGQWEKQINPGFTTSSYSSWQLGPAEYPPPTAIKTGAQMGDGGESNLSLTVTWNQRVRGYNSGSGFSKLQATPTSKLLQSVLSVLLPHSGLSWQDRAGAVPLAPGLGQPGV